MLVRVRSYKRIDAHYGSALGNALPCCHAGVTTQLLCSLLGVQEGERVRSMCARVCLGHVASANCIISLFGV